MPQFMSNHKRFEVNWSETMAKAVMLKHKERRKLIKKIKRAYKRRLLAALQSTIDNDTSNIESKLLAASDDTFINCTVRDVLMQLIERVSFNVAESNYIKKCIDGHQIKDSVVTAPFLQATESSSAISTDVSETKMLPKDDKETFISKDTLQDVVKQDDSATGCSNSTKEAETEKLLAELDVEVQQWHNPFAPVESDMPPVSNNINRIAGEASQSNSSKKTICQFYKKVGACRFGDNCSKYHQKVQSSKILLLQGMFNTFAFDIMQRARKSYLGDVDDLGLEHSDADLFEEFVEFSHDVLPELETFGKVVQFKVCCNRDNHLLGNVYVEYSSEREALAAFEKLNGRFYGGKPVCVKFVGIESWKSAICGLHYNNRNCPRGYHCNYLHVFKDPTRRFYAADTNSVKSRDDRKKDRLIYSSRDERRKSGSSYNDKRSRISKHHRHSSSCEEDSPPPKRKKASSKHHKKKHKREHKKHHKHKKYKQV